MSISKSNDFCTCRTAQFVNLDSLHSPISEIVDNFATLHPEECTVIRERISQMAADMIMLDNEIRRVEKVLEDLRCNRMALKKLSDRHQNALHFTRRLPAEILGEIFILVQDMCGGWSITPTQICRHWRDVAISTSPLWNHLEISYFSSRAVQDAEMAPIWLQRSGGQPLNIVLGNRRYYSMDPEKENHAIDAILHNNAHRWRKIELIINKAMASFIKNLPEEFPMLHTLYIDGPYIDLAISPLDNFRNASALRVLTLGKRVSHASTQFIPNIPWAQLTQCTLLRGGRYNCQDAYRILSQTVALQSFKIEIDAKSSFPPLHQPPAIHLINLLSLDLSVDRGDKIEDLIILLTLPALTALDITHDELPNAPEYLAALINRSGCSLTRLSLGTRESSFTRDAVFELFKLTPALSELELHRGGSVGVDNTMLDLMTHKPNHPPGICCLLPRLNSIKLAVHDEFSYERFLDFLSSRHHVVGCRSGERGSVQLRKAVFILWGYWTASGRRAKYLPWDTYNNFIKLHNGGLDLSVANGNGQKCSLQNYFCPGDETDDSEPEDQDYGYDGPL